MNHYPWKRDRHGKPIERKSRAKCNLCSRPIFGNVNPDKIITFSNCIFALLAMERELKIWYRDNLAKAGRNETARSIESFISEEVGAEIASFKKTAKLRHSNPHIHRIKDTFKGSDRRIETL